MNNNLQTTREIESIAFGIYSAEDIIKMSVVEINNNKKTGANSVYDLRMGSTESQCDTCGKKPETCDGHFGRIMLNEPLINPLFIKRVITFLNCFCLKCSRLLLTKDQIYLYGFNKYKGETRFQKIIKKLEKNDVCFRDECGQSHPTVKLSISDSSIYMVYNNNSKSKTKTSIPLSVDEIKKIFENIPNEDIELIGFDPKRTHPKNFILTVLPVIPPSCRPYVKADENICDDDLTICYCLSPETRVLLWNGKIKYAKDIKLYDVLIGDDGKPTNITNICKGVDNMYEINQRNSDKYIVNSKHKLCVRQLEKKKTIDIAVEEYMELSKNIKSTILRVKCPYISWEKKDIFFDPYMLGLWLGDKHADVDTTYTSNKHILNIWDMWNTIVNKKRKRTNYLTKLLSDYELVDGTNLKKHIPSEYLCNSYNIRMQLLAGIVDSCGEKNKENYIALPYLVPRLLRDVKLLLQSLGFSCVKIRNVLNFTGDVEYIPLRFNFLSVKNIEETPIKVKHIGIGEYIGFQIDNQSKRFLLADCTVTHNCEIIKANNHLLDKGLSDTKRQKYIANLRFKIQTMFNNSSGKAKHTTNGRPIKGFKERLGGKDGQIRAHLLGKRCDQTARTVIGPDPTLKVGQVAVPKEIADNLSIPVHITHFNINEMQKLVDSGGVKFIEKNGHRFSMIHYNHGTRLLAGDIIHRNGQKIEVKSNKEVLKEGDKLERQGKMVEKVFHYGRTYKLEVGNIIERKLQNGDITLVNRQPTLHRASMQAMEIVIRPYKTIRLSLDACKNFNSDFDGDEMNLHIPQTLEAQTELKMIACSKNCIISAQSSKPMITIVQDALIGAYRMTLGEQILSRDQFYNIAYKLDLSSQEILAKIEHIRKILVEKGKSIEHFTGKDLFSLCLPNDLVYEKKNGVNEQEPVVKIYRGVLYEGTIDKNIVGSCHNSLIQIIYKEYSKDDACKFITSVQYVANNWLLIGGFSIGIADCLIEKSNNKEHEIRDVIKKSYLEAENIKHSTSHPGIREMRINSALNKAKDVGLKIAKDTLSPTNNFLTTVKSGSKGDFFNIAQITGLLGQQNLKGARIPLLFNNGKRSLPHYPFGELDLESEYESRGFIASSFIRGLNPREFYFHAMSGREGVSDTAMGTATSGYMQRRIGKLSEDMKIQYDGTVRDTTGKIYELSYGDVGLNPICTVKVKDDQEVCDIGRLITRLNTTYEAAN